MNGSATGKRPLALWALALWVAAVWDSRYARREFWEPDEARYVYVAREMRDTGQWLVPHRNGVPYAHKPPLMFWLINAGETTVGRVAPLLGARLPSFVGLRGAVTREGRGVAVFEEKVAANAERCVPDVVARGHLHMGSKGYVWVAFHRTERRV